MKVRSLNINSTPLAIKCSSELASRSSNASREISAENCKWREGRKVEWTRPRSQNNRESARSTENFHTLCSHFRSSLVLSHYSCLYSSHHFSSQAWEADCRRIVVCLRRIPSSNCFFPFVFCFLPSNHFNILRMSEHPVPVLSLDDVFNYDAYLFDADGENIFSNISQVNLQWPAKWKWEWVRERVAMWDTKCVLTQFLFWGTLWTHDEPIPGAIKFVQELISKVWVSWKFRHSVVNLFAMTQQLPKFF